MDIGPGTTGGIVTGGGKKIKNISTVTNEEISHDELPERKLTDASKFLSFQVIIFTSQYTEIEQSFDGFYNR